jgi:hypothetical protein
MFLVLGGLLALRAYQPSPKLPRNVIDVWNGKVWRVSTNTVHHTLSAHTLEAWSDGSSFYYSNHYNRKTTYVPIEK